MNNEGVSIFGAKFVAEIDFTKALADAKSFQEVIEAIPGQIQQMVASSKASLNELTAAFQQASAAAAGIGGGGGAVSGIAATQSPAVSTASSFMWLSTPQSTPAAATSTPRIVAPPPQKPPVGLQRGIAFGGGQHILPGPTADPSTGYLWTGTPRLPPPAVAPAARFGPAVPYQGPVAAHPYYAGYSPTSALYGMAGSAVPGTHFSPSNQMVHVPRPPITAWTYYQGPVAAHSYYAGYTGGAAPYSMAGGAVPGTHFSPSNQMVHVPMAPGPIDAAFQPLQRNFGAWYDTATAITGTYRRMGSGFGQIFNYQNMMRAAAGLYVGQNIGNLATYAGRQTIGQAMYLEERQALLENALMSEQLDITRDHARARAASLTSASYFAGMPVTAQEMGLSRVELAEQFRQLAPIIRLTARTQDEFQAGLQTGALARALLVARDPVQGTKGSMVALSELYSGGPDRFRSLALRFELPRNRLLEIEQEHGGADVADPGQVLIQMLSEMGFGPNYLVMRSGTLAGQLDRSQALFENFRVELYADAMNKVRDNITRLNDSFERFLDSDAGDAAIERLDRFFGGITGFLTTGLSNVLATGIGTGPMDSVRTARHIGEYMQVRGGEFTNATGQIISAGEAFQEAAQMITGKQFAQAMRSAIPNPNFGLLGMTAMGTIGLTTAGSLLDRVLLAGAGRPAMNAALAGRWGAAGATIAGGLATSLALPLGIAATVAGGAALARQSGTIAQSWRHLAQISPEFAQQYDVPGNIGWSRMMDNRVLNWIGNALDLGKGTFSTNRMVNEALGSNLPTEARTSFAYRAGMGLRDWEIVSPLLTNAYLTSLESGNEVTRASVVGMVQEFVAQNPGDYDLQQMTGWIDFIMNTVAGDNRTTLGTMLAGVVATRAAMGGLTMVGPDGALISDNPALAGSSAEGIMGLWQSVLGQVGGDEAAGLEYLKAMLGSLARIAENTEALAESANAGNYIRPSMAGDIFTGFIENPDMRFTHRSGMPRVAVATTSGVAAAAPSGGVTYAVSGGAVAGGDVYGIGLGAYADGMGWNAYFGGVMTESYGARRANGSIHGGIDYVRRPGEVGHLAAPYAGTVEYLITAEDYARYPGMFGVANPNRDQVGTYGITAVFRDAVAGTLSTYSHLSEETISLYGSDNQSLRAGQKFAVQGNTGYTFSDNGGDGTHVHHEFWVPDSSARHGFTRINPLYSENYFANLGGIQQGVNQGATINISMDGQTFNISSGETRTPEEIVDALLADPKYRAILVGNIAAAFAHSPSAAVGLIRAAEGALARRGQ